MLDSPDTPSSPRARPTRFAIFLGIACIALIAVDAGLLVRVRHLERRVRELTVAAQRAERPTLKEGDAFPAITLLQADGRPIQLSGPLEQEPTLLLISSQGCDYCRVIKPLWEETWRAVRGKDVRVLGLVLDATPDSLAKEDAPYPLVAPGDDAWSLIDRIAGVPGAILIRSDATIARAFYGADQVGLKDAVVRFAGEQ